MLQLLGLSEQAVEFLTESDYGDEWREIREVPRKYEWLRSLMRYEMRPVVKELEDAGFATRDRAGRVLVNMSKLPLLNAKVLSEETAQWRNTNGLRGD